MPGYDRFLPNRSQGGIGRCVAVGTARLEGKARDFWDRFLRETGRPAGRPCYECFAFGTGKEMAGELPELPVVFEDFEVIYREGE